MNKEQESKYEYNPAGIVAHYLNDEKRGYFLDVGSNPFTISGKGSNSLPLEEAGWYGLMFDIALQVRGRCTKDYYKSRINRAIEIDCKSEEFKNILTSYVPKKVTYISLDTDDDTNHVLGQIINAEIRFKIMNIEHDYYVHGDKFRRDQRRILKNEGYECLFENVHYASRKGWIPAEDWWINPDDFRQDIDQIKGPDLSVVECIERAKGVSTLKI